MISNRSLIVASLLSILLVSLHVTDDIVRGFDIAGRGFLILVPIMVLWLYGILILTGRRSGYVIMLIGSLLGAVIPIVHLRGAGLGAAIAQSSGGFFFIWTLLALGVTSTYSFVLAVRGLWGMFAKISDEPIT